MSLFMPQGWVMRSWKLTLNGGQLLDVLLPVLVAVVDRRGVVRHRDVELSEAVCVMQAS